MDEITPLVDADTIAARVAELGRAISEDYEGDDVVLVVVLKGSFVFAADLLRHIRVPCRVDFLGVRSYDDKSESSGVVQITSDLTMSIAGQNVIVVEDIVDTGLTMAYLMENLSTRQPASIRLAALLNKPARARVPVQIDYLGFTIADVFVVGYGLDYAQQHRNLPYLGVLSAGEGER
jgi:hypoxanthine phosphoribosyltransferase